MARKRRKSPGKRRKKDELTEYEKAVLAKLDHDMANGAVELKPLDHLLRRAHELVGDMDIDLDEPIEGEVSLGDPFIATVLPPSKTEH